MTDSQNLAALVTRRRQLVEMCAAEENRLGSARPLRTGLRAHIRWLQRQLARLHTDLDQTIRTHPGWRVQDDLLRSAPGVGPILSATILGGLPELGTPLPRADRRPRGRGPLGSGQRAPPGRPALLGRPGRRPGRWPRSRQCGATPSSGPSTSACRPRARSRKWPSWPVCGSCLDSERHGENADSVDPAPRERGS